MKQTFLKGLKKKLSAFSPREIMFFWYRHYKLVFSLFFLIILGLAGYQWNYSLHQYQWSEEQKKEYIEATFKETRFKEEEFQALVKQLKERQAEHEEGVPIRRDIFTGRSLGE